MDQRTRDAQAPSNVLEGRAIGTEGPRCEANGVNRFMTTTQTITVNGNPGQSNAWTMFRFYVYTPGQSWVVAYIYLAGGG